MLLWWLVGLMLLVVFLAAVLTALGHSAPVPNGAIQPPGFWAWLWTSFKHFLDNSQFSSDSPDAGFHYFAMMAVRAGVHRFSDRHLDQRSQRAPRGHAQGPQPGGGRPPHKLCPGDKVIVLGDVNG